MRHRIGTFAEELDAAQSDAEGIDSAAAVLVGKFNDLKAAHECEIDERDERIERLLAFVRRIESDPEYGAGEDAAEDARDLLAEVPA